MTLHSSCVVSIITADDSSSNLQKIQYVLMCMYDYILQIVMKATTTRTLLLLLLLHLHDDVVYYHFDLACLEIYETQLLILFLQ